MMIQWLTQTIDAHPNLARGLPPEGLLSIHEWQIYARLKMPKRRIDWLLGRWTTKHLLRHITNAPLDAIRILNREDGSPYSPEFPHINMSISHSHGRALCAARIGGEIGADIEHIEPRSPALVDDYFTGDEQAAVYLCSSDKDRLINAIWSAKEAALKAARAGLTVDARSVSCPVQGAASSDWTPFPVSYALGKKAYGWWQQMDDYVLTLVTLDKELPHD